MYTLFGASTPKDPPKIATLPHNPVAVAPRRSLPHSKPGKGTITERHDIGDDLRFNVNFDDIQNEKNR